MNALTQALHYSAMNHLPYEANCGPENEYLDIVRLLLERGADPATPAQDGMTPLLLACREWCFDVALCLASCPEVERTINQVGKQSPGTCSRDGGGGAPGGNRE
jgi:hypothetical protein